ncbi:unnamed protein product [Prorocentrum cordatum]|uniref:Uncharacterized protein n=1 Tax=Prorocentrum cordatum TaxID=2364126 RepID=A0ABN9WLR4_9DINO|nr:unnamed protein product [Polarella glacialis]
MLARRASALPVVPRGLWGCRGAGPAPGGLAAGWERLNELAARGDVPGAEAVFSSIIGEVSPSKRTMAFNTIRACANAGDFGEACCWFERIRRRLCQGENLREAPQGPGGGWSA